MRYILVVGRVPKVNNFCACCQSTLDHGYLRELDTRIKYCGVDCYEFHCEASTSVMGNINADVAKALCVLPRPTRIAGVTPLRATLLLSPP